MQDQVAEAAPAATIAVLSDGARLLVRLAQPEGRALDPHFSSPLADHYLSLVVYRRAAHPALGCPPGRPGHRALCGSLPLCRAARRGDHRYRVLRQDSGGPEATVRAVQLQAWSDDRHPRFARGAWWGGAPRWSLHTLWCGYPQAFARSAVRHPLRAAPRGTWVETEAWLHQIDTLAARALAA